MARARRPRWTAALAATTLAFGGCSTLSEPVRADRDCGDFKDQGAAQSWLDERPDDPDRLDADGNGVACESLGGAAVARSVPRGGRVVAVVDGDTIKVRAGRGPVRTVRLIGIDTPESKRPQTPVECGSKRAASELRRRLMGRDVVLAPDPSQDAVDRYGRALAYVDLDGRDAGEAMVASGWAKPYVYGGVEFARVGAYRKAARGARARGAGVYGVCGGDFHLAVPAPHA